MLLERGTSLEMGCEGSPPAHIAVCVGSHSVRRQFAQAALELLLQFGADPYERWEGRRGRVFVWMGAG